MECLHDDASPEGALLGHEDPGYAAAELALEGVRRAEGRLEVLTKVPRLTLPKIRFHIGSDCSQTGTVLSSEMRVIAKRTLREFWERHPKGATAKTPLQDWHAQAIAADWATPADVKAQFGDASILKGSRVVFNIAGNRYRLVTRINYFYRVVYVRFVGTHQEYDEIDVDTV